MQILIIFIKISFLFLFRLWKEITTNTQINDYYSRILNQYHLLHNALEKQMEIYRFSMWVIDFKQRN